jgi:flagellar biosynthesis/type III secretory pathway protein FliH
MAVITNDSLKLSYDMLFENNSFEEEPSADSNEGPKSISPEEMNKRLCKKDDQWQKRLEKEQRNAEESGFKKGYAEGESKAEEKYMKQIGNLEEMLQQTDQKYNQAFEELKPHLAGLSFDMADKILDIPFKHEELQKRVREEISQLIEKLNEALHVKVVLSEADFNALKDGFEEISHVTLQIDEDFKPGEYTVETKKEYIIKSFKKMIADFKESVSFTNIEQQQT